MKIIRYVLFLGFFLIASAYAETTPLQIRIDKGMVEVELATLGEPYEISMRANKSCQDPPILTKKEDSVTVLHSDQCKMGSLIKIKLNRALSSTVVLTEGLIRFVETRSALKKLSQLQAVVEVGGIQSEVLRLIPTKINNGLGTKMTYHRARSTDLPQVNLWVQTGMIKI